MGEILLFVNDSRMNLIVLTTMVTIPTPLLIKVQPLDVLLAIENLIVSTLPRRDETSSSCHVKFADRAIVPILTRLFIKSIQSGTVPPEWKLAHDIHLQKKVWERNSIGTTLARIYNEEGLCFCQRIIHFSCMLWHEKRTG